MVFRVGIGRGVLDKDDREPAVICGTRGGFDADAGRDAAEDDGGDAPFAEFGLKRRVVEGTTLTFEDDEIHGLDAELWDEFRGGGRRRRGGLRAGFVPGWVRDIREIDVNEDDRAASRAHGVGEADRVPNDLRCGMRCKLAGDDAVLKVDEDESGGLWIEFE